MNMDKNVCYSRHSQVKYPYFLFRYYGADRSSSSKRSFIIPILITACCRKKNEIYLQVARYNIIKILSEMKSWKTNNGSEIFQVLSGRSNSYYIKNHRLSILVDAGMFRQYQDIRQNINILNSTKKLDFLILTHTHFDHCQNTAQLKKEYNCKIMMSRYEKDYANDGYTPLPQGTMFFSKIISGLGAYFGKKRFAYDPFTPDIIIEDEYEFIKDRLDIKIIETPGHSTGSISILIDQEIAIVGDTLFGIYPNSIFPPFANDVIELKESWKKLLKTDCDIFLPGHGKEIKRKLLNSKLRS